MVISMLKVRTVPVETRSLPLEQLKARAPKVEEISSIEASLRLDALASAGTKTSMDGRNPFLLCRCRVMRA